MRPSYEQLTEILFALDRELDFRRAIHPHEFERIDLYRLNSLFDVANRYCDQLRHNHNPIDEAIARVEGVIGHSETF